MRQHGDTDLGCSDVLLSQPGHMLLLLLLSCCRHSRSDGGGGEYPAVPEMHGNQECETFSNLCRAG